MGSYDAIQYVELFHLLLLSVLGRKVDQRLYAVKGGCNLRFFMKSIRYSEDIDLDIYAVAPDKLEAIVSRILDSRPFEQILQVHGMKIQRWSAPKQTDTTQRWKIGLAVSDPHLILSTKLEFSRRGLKQGTAFEPVDPALIGGYQLPAIMVNHYDAHASYEQKVEALATRRVTQARDIFDLDLLLNANVDTRISSKRLIRCIDEAQARAMSISFEVFKAQVLSFLHPDYQAQYDSPDVWDGIVLNVVEALSEKKP